MEKEKIEAKDKYFYTSKPDVQKVYTTEVVVEEQEFAESKKASDEPKPMPDGFMDVPEDIEGGLPFGNK